jgi:hypothetical protein
MTTDTALVNRDTHDTVSVSHAVALVSRFTNEVPADISSIRAFRVLRYRVNR